MEKAAAGLKAALGWIKEPNIIILAEVEAYEVRAVEASYSKMLGKIFTVKQDRYIFFVRTGDLRIMCERNHGNSRVTGGKKRFSLQQSWPHMSLGRLLMVSGCKKQYFRRACRLHFEVWTEELRERVSLGARLTQDTRLTTLSCTGGQMLRPFITMAVTEGTLVVHTQHIRPCRLNREFMKTL